MNVATIKTLLNLVALGLFGWLVHFAYQSKTKEIWSYWKEDYVKGVLDNVVRPETPQARIVSYDQIVTPVMVKFDWTGARPKEVIVAGPEDPGDFEAPLIVVAEVLAIQMVQVDTYNPGGSMALVAWKNAELKSKAVPGVLKIGRKLPVPFDGVVVKDIRPEGIEFAFTREEQDNELVKVPHGADGLITFVDGVDGLRKPKPRELIAPKAPTTKDWPENTRRTAPGMYDLGPADLKKFESDYSRILTEDVRTETYYKDGKRAGLKLTEVKAGSIAAAHGATSGDIVISINGFPVSSEQEAIKFIKNNSETTTVWQVVIENLGRQRVETYNSPPKD